MKKYFVVFLCLALFGSCITKTPLEKLRTKRSLLRSYDGAPPSVPHSTSQSAYRRCLICHASGLVLKSEEEEGIKNRVVGPITPHPEWLNCVQCHIEKKTNGTFRDNDFEPFRITRKKVAKAESDEPAAPPAMPHSMQNRENCTVCHLSQTSPKALQPPHEARDGCQYCHMEDEKAIIYKE